MMKTTAIAALCSMTLAFSAYGNTVSEADKTKLKLRFGAAIPEQAGTYVPALPQLTLMSAKVSAPTSCRGNVGLSITNAFTDGTLKKIYDNFDGIVRELATPSGAIFLASLHVSKSNPNFYQLITEGVDLGVQDFLSAMGSCTAIANTLVEHVGGPIADIQRQSKLNTIIEENARTALNEDWNHVKVEELVQTGLDKAAEAGFNIFGAQKGGKNQPAFEVLGDTLKFGWCIYRGMTKAECEAYFASGDSSRPLPNLQEKHTQIIKTVSDLDRASKIILGEKYLSVCKGCESIELPSYGIVAWIKEAQHDIYTIISDQTILRIADLTAEDYKRVSSEPSIRADANYYRNLALLQGDIDVYQMYKLGWAYDVAYQRGVIMLDVLEDSIRASMTTSDIEKAGVSKELERKLLQIESEREKLKRNSQINNYVPRMYVRMLLNINNKKALNEGLLGLEGNRL